MKKRDKVFYKCTPIIDRKGREIQSPVSEFVPLSEMLDYCRTMSRAGIIYTQERYENR